MQTRPSILPLFRSDTQVAVLAQLFSPGAQLYTISELARRIGAPVSTVSREVAKLAHAGIVRVDERGRGRFVSANPDLPYARQLGEMLDATIGAEAQIADAFDEVEGVEEVIIFGSWAARRTGVPGRTPRDLDVLVVGTPSALAVARAATAAEKAIGLPVNAVTVARSEWETGEDPMIREIKENAHVVVGGGSLSRE